MKENKLSLFFVVLFLGVVGMAVYYGLTSQQENLYYATLQNTALILDEESFNESRLFERASLIASQRIYAKKKIASSKLPIEAFISLNHNSFYYSHGPDLIKLHNKKETNITLNLQNAEFIRGLAVVNSQESQLWAITSLRRLVKISIVNVRAQVSTIFENFLPNNMDVEAFWIHPKTSHLTFATHNEKDSYIVEYDPEHLEIPFQELTLRGIVMTTGFDMTSHYKALISREGTLYVLNWEKKEIFHAYRQDSKQIVQKTEQPYEIHLSNAGLFITRENPSSQNFEILSLGWEKSSDILAIHTHMSDTAALKIQWKFFNKALNFKDHRFFVYLQVKPNDLHQTSVVGLGPLNTQEVVLPLTTKFEDMKMAKVHPNMSQFTLSQVLHYQKEILMKVAAFDQAGRGIASVQNFPLGRELTSAMAVPSIVRRLFLQ
ncbi:MAG: hypothetical protein HYS98_03045 [Deltaproteobacteria bacterium]|nr:hypothetical protein [Deltaproteobacteria bacterium]